MQRPWTQAWLSLGSNLQNPVAQLQLAIRHLERSCDIRDLQASSFYRTPPWGDTRQDDFVNAAVRLYTRLEPRALLDRVQCIENDMGRSRTARRWGPRLIDIDVLLYGGQRFKSDELEIPHPSMHERAFVLVPMAELDDNQEVPGHGNVRSLLERVDTTGILPVADRQQR